SRVFEGRFLHFEPEVVAFASSLADAGEYREAGMLAGDTGDHFLNDDRLAEAGTAEQTGFAAADERGKQVDDLDASDELLGLWDEIDDFGRRAVNGPCLFGGHCAESVNRVPDEVEYAAERLGTDRNADRRAGVNDIHSTGETVGRAEGDGADPA